MAWSLFDFVIVGIALAFLVLVSTLAFKRTPSRGYRIGIILSALTVTALFWVNGAVGIIGAETNDINLLYLGIIVGYFLGGLVSRFKAFGMALTCFFAAIAQCVIGLVGFSLVSDTTSAEQTTVVLVLTFGFFGLWSLSGALLLKSRHPSDSS